MTRTQEMFCFAAVQVESGAEKLRPLFVLIAGVAVPGAVKIWGDSDPYSEASSAGCMVYFGRKKLQGQMRVAGELRGLGASLGFIFAP